MNFIWIVGPPAVGKMAIAVEICKLTEYKMLHNHGSIELLVPFFEFGTPKFNKLNNEFRKRIFEEVSSSDLPGFLFTYVTDLNQESERNYMEKISKIFSEKRHKVCYVEIFAPLPIRLERNKTSLRLDAKPTKRDIKWSDESVIKMDEKYPHMNSSEEYPFFFQENHIKIDNSNLTAREAAEMIIREFNLIKKV